MGDADAIYLKTKEAITSTSMNALPTGGKKKTKKTTLGFLDFKMKAFFFLFNSLLNKNCEREIRWFKQLQVSFKLHPWEKKVNE